MKPREPEKDQSITNPHDVYFKKLIGRRSVAVQFLKQYLPATITAEFDWRTLERVEDTFVTEQLREHFSDLIFRVRLRAGDAVYVYILLEHKSAPDKWVALQLLGYIVDLWQDLKEAGAEKLPLVIPVVFYHGQRRWNVGINFRDLVAGAEREEWRGFVPDFAYHLCDLSRYSDEEIMGTPGLQVGLVLLKYVFSEELDERLERILNRVKKDKRIASLIDQLVPMAEYVTAAAGMPPHRFKEILDSAFSGSEEGETMQTIFDLYKEEGREQGLEEGRELGLEEGLEKGRQEEAANLVLRLLIRRFTQISKRAEAQIRRLSLMQLEQLSEALLDFSTASDLTAWLRANPPAPSKTVKRKAAFARN